MLNRARRELESNRRRTPRLRWLGGFATAAVMVLALTLVLQQEQQAPLPDAGKSDGLQLEPARPAAAPATSLHDEPIANGAPEAAATEQRKRSNFSAAKEKSAALPRDRAAQAPAPMKAETQAMAEAVIVGEDAVSSDVQQELLTAEEWVQRLLRLQEEGDAARLSEELTAFRRAYPDHPLPPSLAKD